MQLVILVWASYSALKTDALRSSETSVNFYQTTRRHTPYDSTLRNTASLNYLKPIQRGEFSTRPFQRPLSWFES
jgi:hypothetical protein